MPQSSSESSSTSASCAARNAALSSRNLQRSAFHATTIAGSRASAGDGAGATSSALANGSAASRRACVATSRGPSRIASRCSWVTAAERRGVHSTTAEVGMSCSSSISPTISSRMSSSVNSAEHRPARIAHDREVRAAAPELAQRVHQRQIGRDLAHAAQRIVGTRITALARRVEQVLGVQDARHAVEVAVVDGDARVARFAQRIERSARSAMLRSIANMRSRGIITSRTRVRERRNTLPRMRPASARIAPASRASVDQQRELFGRVQMRVARRSGRTPSSRTSALPAPFISHSTGRKTRPNTSSGRAQASATGPGRSSASALGASSPTTTCRKVITEKATRDRDRVHGDRRADPRPR